MENSRYVVGIDVGGGSTKASVFDLGGRLVAWSSRPYEPATPAPGIAEYDPCAIEEAAVAALSEALSNLEPRLVQAVAVDAMMSGALAIDETGRAITPYTTTLDTRFSTELDRMLDSEGPRIRALTGSGQPTLAPKIAWLRDTSAAVSDRGVKFVLAGSLVAGRLGAIPADDSFIDSTYLWTTGLADVANNTWSDQLCTAFDIDSGSLPKIVQSTDVVGGISAVVAQRSGLRSGTPIVAGCGDQAAGFVGAGAAHAGFGADSAGTYAVVAAVTDQFIVSSDADAPDVVPVASGTGVNLQSMVVGGGMTRQWASRVLHLDGSDIDSALQAREPGARGVRFGPHLGGQAYPSRPHARGSWIGLSWAHDEIDMYQAVLEGVALSNATAFQRMRELYPDVRVDRVAVYGGGARSSAWNQIKADATGIIHESLGDAPVAGLGAAMLAAQGVGMLEDATLRCAELRRVKSRFIPDANRHATYEDLARQMVTEARILADL